MNGYLGSGYGQDLKALLQQPLQVGAGDVVIEKLHEDITVLNSLPAGATNIYQLDNGVDKLEVVIEVAGRIIPINQQEY